MSYALNVRKHFPTFQEHFFPPCLSKNQLVIFLLTWSFLGGTIWTDVFLRLQSLDMAWISAGK